MRCMIVSGSLQSAHCDVLQSARIIEGRTYIKVGRQLSWVLPSNPSTPAPARACKQWRSTSYEASRDQSLTKNGNVRFDVDNMQSGLHRKT